MMDNKTILTKEAIGMFVGIEIPDDVRTQIRGHLQNYTRFTKRLVPEENWNITVLFVGELSEHKQLMDSVSAAMPQAFIPTISLTHIGKGLQRDQLWAFAKSTALFRGLQKQLMARFNSLNVSYEQTEGNLFSTPHINLGELRLGSSSALLPDLPMPVVWRVEKLNIYHSRLLHREENYSVINSISLL